MSLFFDKRWESERITSYKISIIGDSACFVYALIVWHIHAKQVYFMIRSFKDKETQLIFEGYYSKKLPSDIQKIILRKLIMINASTSVNDLRIPPSNHLEKLSGDLKGWWSIKINNQFRIIFKLDSNGVDVKDVMVTDYH